MAYESVILASRLSLYLAGRQSDEDEVGRLSQSDHHHVSGRAMARRGLAFRDLGHFAWGMAIPRAGVRHRASWARPAADRLAAPRADRSGVPRRAVPVAVVPGREPWHFVAGHDDAGNLRSGPGNLWHA